MNRKTVKQEKKYPCTECGGDAFIGYGANKHSDWGGTVRIGERLCTACFRRQSGFDIFSQSRLRTDIA